ncbi:alpha/beta fold hydrolase [Alkalihalobacillus sp. AL-G]|uniref:alpha/beta fold hydrolase n=1 Tax=Alkalihalobacillus sp. AL-G TaxID=2926399 RepID=UPI00272A109E|nr:alpha/beta hydrolase [Alkalihalobacillus sp. AL-G]WLD93051.1 alpha/beta hydrolase [Alkalihalobacillus sp. AL-G]
MIREINGCSLYYEIYGEGNDDTIFFIHGGPGLGDCRGDVQTFLDLSDRFQTVFLDMRGSGRSADVPPFTHEQWIDDIDALRAELGLDQIILHGSSYGGFIVQEYALKYPKHTKAILLNVTAADNEHHNLAIQNAMSSNLEGIDEAGLTRLFEGKVLSNEDFRTLYGAILPLYTIEQDLEAQKKKLDQIHYHFQTHNDAFQQNLKQFDLKDRLHEIKVPTLVTAGQHDWITPPVCSEDIIKRIPHANYVLFEHYGHSLVREQGSTYKQVVRQFLSEELAEKHLIMGVK